MVKLTAVMLMALIPIAALAADTKTALAKTPVFNGTKYDLLNSAVHFSAPADWSVILKKTDGMPQFYAFQIFDPAAQGSGTSSQVTVEAKVLNDASTFQSLVNAGTDKSKQTPGFEERNDGVDANVLRYFGMDGKQRYEYRETWYLDAKIFLHVRCSRPALDATSAAWTAAYEAGCAQVMQSIRPH